MSTTEVPPGVAERDGYFSGARLLETDLSVAYELLREARYRALERVFGVPRDKQGVVWLIALAMVASGAANKAQQALKAPALPSRGDGVIGLSLLDETVHHVAGDWSRESPLFGTLVALAVVGAIAHPVLRTSIRGVKRVAHQTHADFDRRYGHLIRPNRQSRVVESTFAEEGR